MNDDQPTADDAAPDLGAGERTGNPIVTDLYTSDPAVLVHDGTVYLYTGHDEAPPGVEEFVMRDWHCFSSADLRTWRPHGPLLHVEEFTWARCGAKAGTVVERGGRFFWYVAVDHATVDGGAIGVAVADHPTGPFRDALGSALVTNDIPFDTGSDHTIDPSVIVHHGQAHLFWGKERCFTARLDDSMTALDGPITEIELPAFAEGAHVHERDGWFYLSYGAGKPQRVAYARNRSLDGPWTFEGILNEVPGNCATNRPGIVEFDGGWYFFYHNGVLPGGGSHRRSVCVDRLTYDAQGRMNPVHMTTDGVQAETGRAGHDVPVSPNFTIVILGVADLGRSVAFYRELGWEQRGDPSAGITWFRTSGTWIGLFGHEDLAADVGLPADPPATYRGITLALNYRDEQAVDAALAHAVDAGAQLVKPAARADWGGYSGYFADPDGHLWEAAFAPPFPVADDGTIDIPG